MSAAMREPSLTALEAAREFAARGWRPFPLDHPSLPVCAAQHRRRPCDGKRGKHPVGGWGTQTATPPTDGMLRLWFDGETRNVGIAAGPSGLLILDEDQQGALVALAEELGEQTPNTYRVLTARGWHWYFADPDNEFGNSAGALADHGIDVRGGRGAGGYVVAARSLHQSGVEYVAEDSQAEVAPLPEWVKAVIRTPSKAKTEQAEDGGNTGGGEWTDEPRYGRPAELKAQYERHLAACGRLTSSQGGEFRHALYLAALDGWRLVACGLIDEFTMLGQVRDVIRKVWNAEPDDDDRNIVHNEAASKAASSPWRVVTDPPNAASGESASDAAEHPTQAAVGPDDPDQLEREIRRRMRELRVADEAKRRLNLERRAHRPTLAAGVIDDLDAIAAPAMLMESLIPEQAVGFLAGRSGAYKSFLATSWACCIATGRPWLGRAEFAVARPLRTLYVAAEGAAGAAGRIRAWEASNQVSRAGRLLLYPRAIHLNDAGQAEELAAYVVEHGIEFLVIDTYHRSAPGTEENSSTEFGLVFEAVAPLRDEHGCSTLFLDHTGGGKSGNPRGTSAKRDDADYVISSGYAGEEAVSGAQRELFVTKLKDRDTTGRWSIKLDQVEGQRFPVVVLGTVDGVRSLAELGQWWLAEHCPVMPAEIDGAIDKAVAERRGQGRAAARWCWRLLAVIDDESGLTKAEIQRMLLAAPPCVEFSESMIKQGLVALTRAGIVDQDRSRYWLTVGS